MSKIPCPAFLSAQRHSAMGFLSILRLAGKEIVDFQNELPIIIIYPFATMDTRYES